MLTNDKKAFPSEAVNVNACIYQQTRRYIEVLWGYEEALDFWHACKAMSINKSVSVSKTALSLNCVSGDGL